MSQPWIVRLLVIAIAMPILMCLLFGLGYLLGALEDLEGATVVVRANLVLAVLWVFDVLLLVIALALDALWRDARPSAESMDEIVSRASDEER